MLYRLPRISVPTNALSLRRSRSWTKRSVWSSPRKWEFRTKSSMCLLTLSGNSWIPGTAPLTTHYREGKLDGGTPDRCVKTPSTPHLQLAWRTSTPWWYLLQPSPASQQETRRSLVTCPYSPKSPWTIHSWSSPTKSSPHFLLSQQTCPSTLQTMLSKELLKMPWIIKEQLNLSPVLINSNVC